ncbi:MAG: guanylate kinase [Pseudomonadota bacterium]
MTTSRQGLLIILSSPSGAGKSTLASRLIADDPKVTFSVSATTRDARPGEVDGQHYFFKSRDAFQAMVTDGEMLEHAEVFGNLYGSPLRPVEAATAGGQDVIFDVDWQGGQQIRNSVLRDQVVSIFILPPSLSELKQRLINRAQDSADVVERRMAQAVSEISHWDAYDYVLVNDDIDRCEAELKMIIGAERLKRARQPGLVDLVRSYREEKI